MSKKKIHDFEYFVLNPNTSGNEVVEPISTDEDNPTVAASVTISKVNQGDAIWLNGLLQVDNGNNNNEVDVIVTIFKGTPAGEVLLSSSLEIGPQDTVGDKVLAAVSHVDLITADDKNVLYTFTVHTDNPSNFVALTGPITFTAVRIS